MVLDWRWGGMVETKGPGITGEGNDGGVKGAGDIIEGHLHGGDVGGIALSRPGKNMAADATGGTVEDPCARVAGGCRRRN